MDNSKLLSQEALERSLAEWYSSLLECQVSGREADFFALGGDSVLVALLINRIREKYHVEIPLEQVFKTPKISALAAFIQETQSDFSEIG